MAWFRLGRGNGAGRRVFVLSVDGLPHSFLARHLEEGAFPCLAELLAQGDLRPLRSALPPASAVVWASYATGMNPGRHGIYGPVERRPGTYELFAPDSGDLAAPTIWDELSRAGRTAIVVNVPGTFPPRPVRGVLVAAGRAVPTERLVYPAALAPWLRGIRYRPDIEPSPGGLDEKEDLLAALDEALQRRFEAAFSLLHREPWDFFQLHVSETDRLNHFFWEDYERDAPGYGRAFLGFYRRLDTLIGELVSLVPADAELVLLSGNGFRRLRREVYLNRWLEERGWLCFEGGGPRRLGGISAEARAYCLSPGRVYLHLRGREPRGSVGGADQYRGFRDGVAADLLRLADPESGEPVLEAVIPGEEANRNPEWSGFPIAAPHGRPAPCDLLAIPAAGFELRGGLGRKDLTGRPAVTGAHAGADGFVFVRGRRIRGREPGIEDLSPTLLALAGVQGSERADGRSLV